MSRVTMIDELCQGQHSGCPTCFPLKLRSIQFGASCTPTRRPLAVERTRQETELAADLGAYKSLVQTGVQPARTKGAAMLQSRADSKFEIESGKPIFNKQWSKKVETVLADLPKVG